MEDALLQQILAELKTSNRFLAALLSYACHLHTRAAIKGPVCEADPEELADPELAVSEIPDPEPVILDPPHQILDELKTSVRFLSAIFQFSRASCPDFPIMSPENIHVSDKYVLACMTNLELGIKDKPETGSAGK